MISVPVKMPRLRGIFHGAGAFVSTPLAVGIRQHRNTLYQKIFFAIGPRLLVFTNAVGPMQVATNRLFDCFYCVLFHGMVVA
ncbi:MAG: hypothetical protein ROZ00_09155 [Denitratisoma sp.]|nr:hypothetical protein [Denitratisoma sp.]